LFCKKTDTLIVGTGQTSRVDALLQAIEKLKILICTEHQWQVMLFPFPDCVEAKKQV
jgi:phosphoribosylaminoimidazolecarboxamide formyltransferase/IMP cyclohydrolase